MSQRQRYSIELLGVISGSWPSPVHVGNATGSTSQCFERAAYVVHSRCAAFGPHNSLHLR